MVNSKRRKFTNNGEDKNLISLSDWYGDNCSEQELLEVSDAVLNELINFQRADDNYIKQQSRHKVCSCPDENILAGVYGLCSDSADDVFFKEKNIDEAKQIEKILGELSTIQRKRLYMRFALNYTYKEISEFEGVSIRSIQESCELAISKLKKHICFLQTVDTKDWIDLLI